jgi:outer membrane biosynthesis protein TonB
MRGKISLAVVVLHMALVAAMVFGSTAPSAAKKKQRLIVKTVSQQMETKTVAAAPPAKKHAPMAPVRPIKTAPQQKAKAPPVQKKTPQKKSQIAPKPKPVPKNLIDSLEESIAKIEKKQDKVDRKETLNAPIAPAPLQLDSLKKIESTATDTLLSDEDDYRNILVECLRSSLNLPDFGEVKMQLTIRTDGTVVQMRVLNSASEKNRVYLENSLRSLRFPPLLGELSRNKQHTFQIVFCNEM